MPNTWAVYVIVVLWFSKVYGYYTTNLYTLENHSTADLYCDATNQILGSVFPTTSTMLYHKHHALLGCMSFLEYMGFVLVVFPLKCGFIIVQVNVPADRLRSMGRD